MKREKALFLLAVLLLCAVFLLVPFAEYPELKPVTVTVFQTETISAAEKKQLKESNLINVNTAEVEELVLIPGIGEVKAEAIISYRNENGMFNSVEELINVSGIGEKTLEKILPYVCV